MTDAGWAGQKPKEAAGAGRGNMISVTVYINNVPIITRSARNIGPVEDALGAYAYAVDDGRQVVHLRHEGAARLAIMMLEGVVTP